MLDWNDDQQQLLAAIKAGATKEDIGEALGVAICVNAGAALVYSARVMDAYAAKTG
jgi:alkylhydroperoxidase/carboxymuconolactone decarboxylase family protein YurZ